MRDGRSGPDAAPSGLPIEIGLKRDIVRHTPIYSNHRGIEMSVRKRKWTTRKGDEKEAWVVNYTEPARGRRVLKTFRTKIIRPTITLRI